MYHLDLEPLEPLLPRTGIGTPLRPSGLVPGPSMRTVWLTLTKRRDAVDNLPNAKTQNGKNCVHACGVMQSEASTRRYFTPNLRNRSATPVGSTIGTISPRCFTRNGRYKYTSQLSYIVVQGNSTFNTVHGGFYV